MMKYIKNKKKLTFLLLVIVLGFVVVFMVKGNRSGNLAEFVEREISPEYGTINVTVSTTGSIRPQNRLELKPSISGRIENILVDEGAQVNKGDILVWMSSMDRAALLDAAKIQGNETVKYWEEVYKATPIIAPIDGEVIVRSVEPGQTVSSAEAVLVLSDRLIVEALVDETDIGKVKVGNPVTVSLDAYPLEEISGVVDHILHESTVRNNVTMYAVEIAPSQVPAFFRSGMNANVDIIVESKKNILYIPVEAVKKKGNKAFVLVKKGFRGKSKETEVKIGITDEENVEVVAGLTAEDEVIIKTKIFKFPQEQAGKNPFDPDSYQKKEDSNKK